MLRVHLRPSRLLAATLITAHTSAGITLFPLDLPLWIKLTLACALAVSLVHTLLRTALLRTRASPVALELRNGDEAAVQTRDGVWRSARVLATTYVSPFLTLVNLRIDGRVFAQHLVIVSDNVDAEDFRQLRVLLQWAYRGDTAGQATSPARPTEFSG